MANEFLPICDNLFNVISLAAYFCDCVFDIVLGYALLERGRINFFVAVVLIIAGSLIVSQVRTDDGVIAVGSGTEVVNLSF
jgi:XK-related protein